MARRSDLTNLKNKQIQEILFRMEEPTDDPLVGLEEGSDIEDNLTESEYSFDSSYDESCNEASPQKAQSVRLLPLPSSPGRRQSSSGSVDFVIRRPLGQRAAASGPGQSRGGSEPGQRAPVSEPSQRAPASGPGQSRGGPEPGHSRAKCSGGFEIKKTVSSLRKR